jgi:hypothetical protein
VSGSKVTNVLSNGTFSTTFSVGLLQSGTVTATATDSCGRTASKSFSVVAGL